MYINMKKIIRYALLFVVGMSLFFYGMISWIIEDHSAEEPTDAEIIERARALGMVGLDEVILENLEENE